MACRVGSAQRAAALQAARQRLPRQLVQQVDGPVQQGAANEQEYESLDIGLFRNVNLHPGVDL